MYPGYVESMAIATRDAYWAHRTYLFIAQPRFVAVTASTLGDEDKGITHRNHNNNKGTLDLPGSSRKPVAQFASTRSHGA